MLTLAQTGSIAVNLAVTYLVAAKELDSLILLILDISPQRSG